ncbi:type II toxin-antitoxin system RatA family toxin [Dongia sedimenti]|uniref:Type II toxin-antitoxin system RatA family toxin n=1 Tax=Dongia sedimenti TaxID=3064282 RepID=A0ABU0YJY4_9PROT|nr:type II toxin-antitoxin system RatA family toxin [Rhodospirillaceae bacterium R-7]
MAVKTHTETRLLPYTPQQMFDLVADVARYPEFLPWCVGARIKEQQPDMVLADLMIGFKMVREKFTSRVWLHRAERRIDVEYINGPFRQLQNHWTFHDDPGGCRVEFFLEFEFSSLMLQKLIGVLFHEAVRRMVAAFESRARQLYG